MKRCLFCQLLGAQKIIDGLFREGSGGYIIERQVTQMNNFVADHGLEYEMVIKTETEIPLSQYIQIQKVKK